jgi:ferredoxin
MSESATVVIDWVACDGRGLCAELLPERIHEDEWGFPVIDPTPMPPGLTRTAKQAVSSCPRLALQIRSAR